MTLSGAIPLGIGCGPLPSREMGNTSSQVPMMTAYTSLTGAATHTSGITLRRVMCAQSPYLLMANTSPLDQSTLRYTCSPKTVSCRSRFTVLGIELSYQSPFQRMVSISLLAPLMREFTSLTRTAALRSGAIMPGIGCGQSLFQRMVSTSLPVRIVMFIYSTRTAALRYGATIPAAK